MASGWLCFAALSAACLVGLTASLSPGEYDPHYGTFVGEFSTLHHEVAGNLYAVDNITIHIRGFTYDGEAPDAYFFAGNRTPKPTNKGFIILNEKNEKQVLGPHRNKNLVMKFPLTPKGQRGFYDIKWISVWCERFAIDFGHVLLPEDGVETPAPVLSSSPLSSDAPLLTSPEVWLMDTNTINVRHLTYDGSVKDAIFVVGSGAKDAAGIQVPDERGQLTPLRKYNRETVNLKLPKATRGSKVQYVGVWSPTEGMIASVTFPVDARVPPALENLV